MEPRVLTAATEVVVVRVYLVEVKEEVVLAVVMVTQQLPVTVVAEEAEVVMLRMETGEMVLQEDQDLLG